jgi:hypothetical protein
MKPTNKLRFVERTEPITETTGKRVRILQQWWVFDELFEDVEIGDWRDVPVEAEA